MNERNPARGSKQAFLALAGILGGAAITYFTLSREVVLVMAPVLFAAALGALMVGLVLGGQARSRARMECGEGVVARWTLDAAHWQEFVRLNGSPIAHAARRSTGTDVEVVFAENAVYVDGEYYTMDRTWGTYAKLEPAASGVIFIELSQGGLETHSPLRVPVPCRGHGQATSVVRYFNDPAGRG